jgi:ribosomal protein L37AE/L43A
MGVSSFDSLNPDCPVCDNATVYLGRLGTLDHWSCRACGHQSSTPAEPDPVPEEEGWEDQEDQDED